MTEYCDATRAALEPLIQKPKLVDKLLQKPPFKFLHDVVMAVHAATGYPGEGFFTAEESTADAIQDKAQKIAFLQRVIDIVQNSTGSPLAAKPQKIVAGLEPENTNGFLQALGAAAAAHQAQNSAAAETKPKRKKKKEDAAEPAEAPAEGGDAPKKKKKAAAGAEGGEKKPKKAAAADGDKPKKKAAAAEGGEKKTKKAAAAEGGEKKKTKKKKAEGEEDAAAGGEKKKKSTKKKEEAPVVDDANENSEPAAQAQPAIPPPSSNFAAETPKAEERSINNAAANNNNSEDTKPLVRPSSARPAPPRIQSNVRTVEKAVVETPLVAKKVAVIEEGKAEDDEEDHFGLDEEDEKTPEHDEDRLGSSADIAAVEAESAQHGGLVRDIIAANKALEQQSDTPKKKESSNKVELSQQHHKEVLQKEVNKLREEIQVVCRSVNPLGKTMDYVQEDFEIMSKELQKWKEESSKQQAILEEEARITEQSLQPMHQKLHDLDQQIREIMVKTNGVKASVVRNDVGIAKMLTMVVNH